MCECVFGGGGGGGDIDFLFILSKTVETVGLLGHIVKEHFCLSL